MNNTELLPCPFCGNTEPKLVPQGNAPEAFVYCGKCDLTANLTETAIKKWNTRASTPAPVERIEGLAEAVSAFTNEDLGFEPTLKSWITVLEAARAYLKLQGGE